jgi:osmoprotectant transport system ATP-binding protein
MQGHRQTSPAEPVVAFDDVGLRLGGRQVLDGLDFRLADGETLVLVGRSGTGKSSALKLVNRLLEADAGQVRVGGRPVDAWDPIELRRRTGYVIQGIGLFPHLTVAENAGLVPRLLDWEAERVEARVGELLEMVGLPPATFAGRYPRELSGGQQQRVGVARALAADPPLLLCDEPFGALDPVTRRELQNEFRELSRRLETSLLFVTHDVREALLMGDRIGLLEDGKLAFLDSPDAFRESDRPLVRAFLGESWGS